MRGRTANTQRGWIGFMGAPPGRLVMASFRELRSLRVEQTTRSREWECSPDAQLPGLPRSQRPLERQRTRSNQCGWQAMDSPVRGSYKATPTTAPEPRAHRAGSAAAETWEALLHTATQPARRSARATHKQLRSCWREMNSVVRAM